MPARDVDPDMLCLRPFAGLLSAVVYPNKDKFNWLELIMLDTFDDFAGQQILWIHDWFFSFAFWCVAYYSLKSFISLFTC